MRNRDTRWFLAGERVLDFTKDSSTMLEHQRAGRRAEVAANAAIRSSIESLRTITAGLHAIVMSGPKRDAATAAVWQSARRLGPAKAAAPEDPAPKAEPPSSPSKIA